MSSISKPSKLDPFAFTTVSFEDIGSLDGEQFGFKAGQPYVNLGVVFHAAVVAAKAQVSSPSGGVAVRSATIYTHDLQNSLFWTFSTPQRAVGFYYRDTKATSLTVRALDAFGNPLEEATFPPGDGYAGFVRDGADIVMIQTLAPHTTFEDADRSRTYVDDLSFASELKDPVFKPKIPHGIPYILLGAIPAGGGGIGIGPTGVVPWPPVGPEQRQILVAASLLSSAEALEDSGARRRLRSLAGSLLKASQEKIARGK
jgi:hypothetical protein